MSRDPTVKLQQRRVPFEFPSVIPADWIPGEPEFSAMINGGSMPMPYLEPFLIRTLREASAQITDEGLRDDVNGFNAQEGQHFRTHRRFNDLIKASRYPGLAAVEDSMAQSYSRLEKRSLRARVAYSAGFESMTIGLTHWLVESRSKLFKDADPQITSFVLWHMVEEVEHKRVAYDVYQHLFGGSLGGYVARALGVFHGSLDVMLHAMRAYKVMLKHDGKWQQLRSRLRLANRLWQFVYYVAPTLLRAALPGHNPRSEKDPQWVLDWLEAYQHVDANYVPLIDTHHPQMPIPFPVQIKAVAA